MARCLECEGSDPSRMLEMHLSRLDDIGWTFVGVAGRPAWAYTVGLTWNFDHPELIIVHPSPSKSADVVGHAVREVVWNRQFDTRSILDIPCGGLARFGSVHRANLSSEWFAMWPLLAMADDGPGALSSALQLILGCTCVECASVPLLDQPRLPGRW